MHRLPVRGLLGLGIVEAIAAIVCASPGQDWQAFKADYKARSPAMRENDLVNGIDSSHKPSRNPWAMMEEFPPCGLAVADGKDRFRAPFANGQADVGRFENGGSGHPTKPSRLRQGAG